MADGTIDVHVDGLLELGTGLRELGGTLEGALEAVDGLPIDSIAPVVGPIGADFMSALMAATARHRDVLAGVARVTDAAGELVHTTAQLYSETDAAGAQALGEAGRGVSGGGGVTGGDTTEWRV